MRTMQQALYGTWHNGRLLTSLWTSYISPVIASPFGWMRWLPGCASKYPAQTLLKKPERVVVPAVNSAATGDFQKLASDSSIRISGQATCQLLKNNTGV